MDQYEKESVIRGHHVYKSIWMPHMGEELIAKIDDNNEHDQYAV